VSLCFSATETLGCVLACGDHITLYENNVNLLGHDVEGFLVVADVSKGISIKVEGESESERESGKVGNERGKGE